MARMQCLNKSPITSQIHWAYLSTWPSSLSTFMTSKAHISAQKRCRKQLNTKVCGSLSAICSILSFFFLTCTTIVTCMWKRCKVGGLYIYCHFYINPPCLYNFLVCRPYTFFYISNVSYFLYIEKSHMHDSYPVNYQGISYIFAFYLYIYVWLSPHVT